MLSQIVSFVVPLVYLCGFTASLVYLTKRSFGKCLPIAMMLSAFLLFFSQLIFGTFNVGFVLGILFAVISIGLGAWKRKEWEEYKKLLFSSGFIVFLVVYVLVFIYDFARGFSVWDEFSHWGMMVKEMVRLDGFYSVEASNLMVHKDYPPIMQLFELFWTKLCGGYGETYLLRALHTFELSLFIPFIADKIAEKKNVWKSVLVGIAATFAVALAVFLFDQHGVFQAIYTDYAMALVVVYLLMSVFVNKKISWFEILTLSVGGGYLLLLKQMGLPLYLMVICALVGIVWLRKNVGWKEYFAELGWKRIVGVVVALAIPFVVWFVWGRVVEGTVAQFSLADLSVMDFIKVLIGHGEDWQSETVRNYVMALGQENISTSWFLVSYVQGILIFVGGIGLAWWVFRKYLDKKEMVFLGVLVVLGAVGYAVAMLALYVLAFGSYEGPVLASYNRYMGTYLMIMAVLVVMIVIWQASNIGKRGVIYAMAIGLAVLTAPEVYVRAYRELRYDISSRYEVYEAAAMVLDDAVEEDAKVFLVVQDVVTGAYFYLQYYATPMRMNYGLATWPTNETSEYYYNELALPAMSEYDYLLLADFDEEFEKSYCGLLQVCPIAKWNLYKIIKNDAGEVKRFELVKNLGVE